MQFLSLEFILYLVLVLVTAIVGILRWPKLGRADKWIAILMVVTVIQEMAVKAVQIISNNRSNNLNNYLIYTPLEFFLVSMYFGDSVAYFRERRMGIKIGIVGVILYIALIILFQRFLGDQKDYSVFYYLFFECCIITVICFFAFYRMLMQEDVQPYSMAGFWLTVCFLLYWCITFAGWGLLGIASAKKLNTLRIAINITREIWNYLFYTGVLLVFINYPKLKPSGE